MSVLCPRCHRPFSKEFEKNEIAVEGYHEGEQFTGTRSKIKTPIPVDRGKQIVNFKYYYKCKHCGFEWSEIKRINFDSSVE